MFSSRRTLGAAPGMDNRASHDQATTDIAVKRQHLVKIDIRYDSTEYRLKNIDERDGDSGNVFLHQNGNKRRQEGTGTRDVENYPDIFGQRWMNCLPIAEEQHDQVGPHRHCEQFNAE